MDKKKAKPVPPVVLPYDAENNKLSKAQFIAKMRAKKELDAKLNAYRTSIESEVIASVNTEVVKEEVKKPGRPKKIE